ncbi:hypothetical protein V8E36_005233, partial [Tilletia maclaganii]
AASQSSSFLSSESSTQRPNPSLVSKPTSVRAPAYSPSASRSTPTGSTSVGANTSIVAPAWPGLGSLRPVGTVDASWVWSSLSANNTPTVEMSASFALFITPLDAVAITLSPAQHLVQAAHGTDDLILARELALPLARSVQTNTRVAYGRVVINYLRWCEEIGLPLEYRFPAGTNILTCFLTHDLGQRRASTTELQTSAMMHWHRIHRMP